MIFYNWESLTYKPDSPAEASPDVSIAIGPIDQLNQVRIKSTFLTDDQANSLESFDSSMFMMSDGRINASKVNFQDDAYLIPWTTSAVDFDWDGYPPLRRTWPMSSRLHRTLNEKEWPSQVTCASLGPHIVNNHNLATIWDDVALTEYEDLAINALNLVLGDSSAERIALLGDYSIRSAGRRFVVKVKGQRDPVPLKRFGEGAVRLFGMALTLANSKGSILLIDEVENGVHHSVQHDLWKMIFSASHTNNTQVIATTHSWDCVKGFAQAAMDDESVEGCCIRLERDDDSLYAVEYSEEELETVISYGIEVRYNHVKDKFKSSCFAG